jgi:hypothetical protein
VQAVPLTIDAWRGLEEAYAARADARVRPYLERRRHGRSHPVEDFLFVYYANSPGKLRRWHPGPGVVLEDAGRMRRASWRGYVTGEDGSVCVDVTGFARDRAGTITFVTDLMRATLQRPSHTGCFGLHEWAMIYRLAPQQIRHAAWPLRLAPSEVDTIVESHEIRCTHVDAYRFFTPDALARNAFQPTRDTQIAMEQPGCLHAGMDLYKWAYSLTPLVPSDVVLDAFDLAMEIRVLDMRASPYDLRELGYDPIAIETAAGKGAYASAQRAFAKRANELRVRLLKVLDDCG